MGMIRLKALPKRLRGSMAFRLRRPGKESLSGS